MSLLDSYCHAWPDEIKEAHWKWKRAYHKTRNLEAAIERCEPSEFDALADSLKAAAEEMHDCARECYALHWG